MMTPVIREKCPRCGGWLRPLSGFQVCGDCGHRMGSQSIPYRYGQITRYPSSDEQTRPERRHNPRGRNPLNFR